MSGSDEFLRRARRSRRARALAQQPPPEPELEQPPKRLPLVSQGPRSPRAPYRQPTIDDFLREFAASTRLGSSPFWRTP